MKGLNYLNLNYFLSHLFKINDICFIFIFVLFFSFATRGRKQREEKNCRLLGEE